MERTYLDHAATTPVLPEARQAVAEALEAWANPSSAHSDGRSARARLDETRRRIADALGWRHDVILTSGATEAIGIAANRAKAERRAHCAIEHHAVGAAMGAGSTKLPVTESGLVDLDALDLVLAEGSALIAVQQVNNETGVLQPIEEIARRVRSAGSLLLADCAQSAGKLDLPDADFISVSAHKLGGPPGIGALLVRDLGSLHPCGGQEKGYRRGTENLPAAAGMAAALQEKRFRASLPELARLRSMLDEAIEESGGIVIAKGADRLPAIGAVAMPGLASAAQLVQFDLAGISVSAGSACTSGSLKPSHVHLAMGLPAEIAASTIRVSFGPCTEERDVGRFIDEWRRIRLRSGARAA